MLIVDDDRDIRAALRGVLTQRGFEVQMARDGDGVIERMRQGPLPCVVLLDVWMPNLDGISLAQEIRRDPRIKHVPLIFMTACGTGAVLEHEVLLEKPFSIEGLTSKLQRIEANCRVCRTALDKHAGART